MTKLIVSLALVATAFVSYTLQDVNKWEGDMDFWLSEVKKQHYIYRSKPLPAEFDTKFRDVRSKIRTYSDQRALVELLGLSAMLGDGHTYVLPWGASGVETKSLPLRFYLFGDGLFVIDASKEHEQWIGRKITHFGSIPSDEMMKRVAMFVSRDNEQGVNWIGPFLLSFEGMLQATGVEGNGIYALAFDNGRGGKEVHQFAVTTFQPVRGIPKLMPPKPASITAPLYLQNVPQSYWMRSIKNTGTLYVQFNQVMNDSNESIAQFSRRLSDSIAAQSPKKLIVDVRHNNGGNADLLEPLLTTLQQYKTSGKGELYILTGRNTFSAAQIFISRADKMMRPVFAGELSSSKPNFVGEENGIELPNSGAITSISNRYHESIPGDNRQGIEPQIKVLLRSTDYFSGRDPVMDAILKR